MRCPVTSSAPALFSPLTSPTASPQPQMLEGRERRRTSSLAGALTGLAGSKIDAFVTAAFVGDLAQVKREVNGPDIDRVSPLEGRTALQAAAESGHADIAAFLLGAGANPDQQDSRSWTPLHHAACRGHLEVTRVLLENGASAAARAAREGLPRNSVCARWLRFMTDAFCGPTPRHCAADPAVRALLLEYERRQLPARLLCRTPIPLRHWRRECVVPNHTSLPRPRLARAACDGPPPGILSLEHVCGPWSTRVCGPWSTRVWSRRESRRTLDTTRSLMEPRPRRLRLRAEENDDPHFGCSTCTLLWWRLRRCGDPSLASRVRRERHAARVATG